MYSNLNISDIEIKKDHDDSMMEEEIPKELHDSKLNKANIILTPIIGHNPLALNDTMVQHSGNDLVDNIINDSISDVRKTLRMHSKESIVSRRSPRRILRETNKSNKRRYDSSRSASFSRSRSRSRNKKTRSRTEQYERRLKYEDPKNYETNRLGFRHRRHLPEQIIIFNIPMKFDRDMEFYKHIISLFPELRIVNFSHDSMREGFIIARLIDEPSKVQRFYDNFVSCLTKFREYEFKVVKHDNYRVTPLLKFTYKVVKFNDLICLE